ncbi:hypothetical protein Hanom_Chr10g00879501 [Helianthus anomalus]
MIKQALGSRDVDNPQSQSELTWNCMELSVMLNMCSFMWLQLMLIPGLDFNDYQFLETPTK